MLIVCLLGMGLLLPSANITAKEFFIKRVVDVYKDGLVLQASSDSNTGGITMIRLYDSSNVKVAQQSYESVYSCSISLAHLASGGYHAQVTTTLTVYYEDFSI
jgi:hypothetical protein